MRLTNRQCKTLFSGYLSKVLEKYFGSNNMLDDDYSVAQHYR